MRHPHHHHCGPRPRARHGFGRGGYGPGPGPRRHRARRGQVRAAILVLLGEEPRNGYALMQEIETRSDGAWRPSPGSMYPALALLEDEGLIRSTGDEDQRSFELTDAGRKALDDRGEDATDPWDAASDAVGTDVRQAWKVMRQVGMGFSQVIEAGSPAQIAKAEEILAETRRSLYGILAEDPADREAGEDEA